MKLMQPNFIAGLCALTLAGPLSAGDNWVIDSDEEWNQSSQKADGLTIKDGLAEPKGKTATYLSKVQRYDEKRSAKSITLSQSPVWQNWEPIKNLGPSNLADAPIFLSLGPDNYWAFGRYSSRGGAPSKEFKAEPTTLEGFEDTKLMTTHFPNQYNAPGGLGKSQGGYHAWQSKDMVNWVHHGPVTEGFSRWSTTAEYADGKLYLYYDFPNDQDPHVYIDDDLFDGKPGKNMGMALKDPSHGSDCAVIRDLDGTFHIIFEDWSPISANKRSWDSPLAGLAVSKKGEGPFEIIGNAVDERTEPTGEIGTYKHPHWAKEDPENYKTNVAEYEIHTPEQHAYGDWAAISIGGQYYLFGDYDPAGAHGKQSMSVGWFTSDDLKKQFTWCDNIGKGHPDPDIGFAEGRFYLWTQQNSDFVSDGPWVESVQARVGVDTDNDGEIDQWTDWQQVKESYDYIEGFAKQVSTTPAALDTSKLPEGFGFAFELKLEDTTENKSKPMIDSVTVEFE